MVKYLDNLYGVVKLLHSHESILHSSGDTEIMLASRDFHGHLRTQECRCAFVLLLLLLWCLPSCHFLFPLKGPSKDGSTKSHH